MSLLLPTLAAALSVTSAQSAEAPQCISNIDRLLEADLNNDGQITREEVGERRAQIFERLDRNGDGVARSSDAPRFARGRYNEALNQLLSNFDSNGDGELSQAEFVEGPTIGFDRIDANADDRLDTEEMSGLQEMTCE